MGFTPRADLRRAEDAAEDPALQAGMHADEDVLERGHLLEEADVLERPADTALGGGARRRAGDVPAVEPTRPDVGL